MFHNFWEEHCQDNQKTPTSPPVYNHLKSLKSCILGSKVLFLQYTEGQLCPSNDGVKTGIAPLMVPNQTNEVLIQSRSLNNAPEHRNYDL